MEINKTAEVMSFVGKMRLMRRLYFMGCKTEKDLLALSLLEVLRMEDITIEDIVVILELQRAVKKHTLYSYLFGQDEAEQEKNQYIRREK